MAKQPIKTGTNWTEDRSHKPGPTSKTKFLLAEQAEDFHFFNHGALYVFGGLDVLHDDPVYDWIQSQPISTEIIRQPFMKPVFQGLDSPCGIGNLPWNNIVMAVRHEYWQSLWEYLGGIVTLDEKEKLYCQMFSGDIKIVDPVFAERHSLLQPGAPSITITVFCADTNKGRYEIRPPTPGGLPRFVEMPARPEVTTIARAALKGDMDALKRKDNPAFQPLVNKYTELTKGLDE